jgi:hypothetical protein
MHGGSIAEGEVASERVDTAREPNQPQYGKRRQDKKCEQHDAFMVME